MQKKQIISSIIVPNLKKDLLDSFLSNNLQFFDFKKEELIIVSSTLNLQNIADYQKKYPKVRFIAIKKNKGFASTVNLGFKKAKARKWLVTINDDVILSKGWLGKLTMDLPDNIGSINPIIVDKNGDIESAGIKILVKGKAMPISTIPKKVLTKVDVTNAACVVYSKNALQKVGFFDEKFGSYLEDIDLSLRLKRNGFINMVNNAVKITHLKHSTAKNMAGYKNYLDFKNWILVICKNWGFGKIMKYFPTILLERGRNLSGVLKNIK